MTAARKGSPKPRRKSSKLSKADQKALECERLYRNFRRQPAQLDDEEVVRMDRHFTTVANESGYVRRAALVSLTKSGKDLCKDLGPGANRETLEAFVDLYVRLQDLCAHYEGVVETLRAADVRLMMAMAPNEDFVELCRAAKKEAQLPATH